MKYKGWKLNVECGGKVMLKLSEEILNRKVNVAIIGLGYVGLPLGVAMARAGFQVIGIDYNEKCVEMINNGISRILDVSSDELKNLVSQGKIQATTDYSNISRAQVIVICVPTPLNESKEPDLSYINKAVDGILPYITKKTLISLESTTYPGTTDELIVNRVIAEKGWQVGEDFFVCYSPERVDPGNKLFSVENTPKVIGGSTSQCLELGKVLYESFLPKVVCVKSTRVAEMTKILENTFRCVNIALINEMTMMCERMKIDIWEVIEGASSKPFGFMPFYPGPGVGGHCIPLDPLYLSWEAKKYNFFSRFIETASDINSNMPYYIVRQIEEILSKQEKVIGLSRILLLGMSYKKDVGDLRESPSLEIYELLQKKGANVAFYDPYILTFNRSGEEVAGTMINEENISQFELVVILTNHSNINYKWVVEKANLIYDTRNACKEIESSKVIRLGQSIV